MRKFLLLLCCLFSIVASSQDAITITGKVLDAVQMDGAKYAIAHENGLYSYTYSPNYLNLITAGTSFQSVSFDVENATLIGATQNVLNEITTNGQVIHTIVATDSITSADIHYTR